MRDFKQHDVTDCGAACLSYVFYRHGLHLSISSIRQKTGTSRTGTTALGLVDTARSCGFDSKGVRCKYDDIQGVVLPAIAHVFTDSGRPHYVVICSLGKKTLRVMDPAIGRIEKWSVDKFKAQWTNVLVVLAPSLNFVPSQGTESSWSKLIALLRPQKAVIAQAFVSVVLGTILSLSGAIYVQKIIDNVIVDGNRNLLHLLGIGMFVILGIRILLGYFQSILMLKSAQKIDTGLILGYYRHLMRLPQSFFDTMRVGEITSRVRDSIAVRNFLNSTVLSLIVNPLILIVAFIAMFIYSWKIALYSLALIPANLIIYFISDWINKRYQREIMEREADFDSQLVESLHAMSVVRSCGMESEMEFRSETRLVRLMKRVWTASKAGFVVNSSGSIFTQAYSIGLLWMGADLVLNSQLTAGQLMSCNALAGYLTGPIMAIIGMNASIRTATTATDRLYEILDLEREKDEGVANLILSSPFGLDIENVSFRYPGRLATLSDLSLTFQSGTITALVGKSGCGKSTLLALLQRHYKADAGKIILGGVDINYASLTSLRSQIAYVPQRIDMLAGTVLENLAPNETQPDINRVIGLCRRVGMLDFIESLPRGFQSLITENGANLSGGQKQRIAIIRALYKDAPVLLFDEPSSALDAGAEDLLMNILWEQRQKGKLVILALHNRRLLELCDTIVELDSGKLVAIRAQTSSVAPAIEAKSDSSERLSDDPGRPDPSPGPIDLAATAETKALFRALRDQDVGGILFGQTDANVMGIDESGKGWILQDGRCDIAEVTGKKPAVYGFDILHLNRGWEPTNQHMVPKIREAYANDGLITVGWHPENPADGGSFHGGSPVADVLPGGPFTKVLNNWLDLIADKLGNLVDSEGQSIPILFRPWHGANTDSFWWGQSRCTAEEYRRLYQYTVQYLRDIRSVRNFLYVYSPAGDATDKPSFFSRYPGNDYVDVIGLILYGPGGPEWKTRLTEGLHTVASYATTHGKIAAFAEVGFKDDQGNHGLHHCHNLDWIETEVVAPLCAHPKAQSIAYVTFWRNDAFQTVQYFLPYSGSAHAPSLTRISNDPRLIFGDRSRALYTRNCSVERALTT